MSLKFSGAVGKEEWASSDIGARYKPGERVTAVVARALLQQSGVLESPHIVLLDNACGTGIVTHEFFAAKASSDVYDVTCADFSDGMVETVQKRAEMEGWHHTRVVKADAQDTGLSAARFTHVLTSLGFGIFPNSDAALNEIDRMLIPGGTIGLTTWKHIGWPQLFQRGLELAGCTSIVLPDLLATSLARMGYDWASPEAVEAVLVGRGYSDVVVRVLPTMTKFSKDEIVNGDMGRMPLGMIMSLIPEEERVKWHDKVLPALAEHWDELFGADEGLYSMEMVAIVATAKKSAVAA